MDDKRLDALRRRVRRAGESANCPGREQLLDALERFLVASSLDTAEDLAEAFAAWLAGRPDDWEMWISGAREDRDHLAWKIVQALVRILRDREPERLMDHPPLFDWVLDVATGLCPEPARPGGGPDERLSRIRHRAIAMTVARLASLPDGPPSGATWSTRPVISCPRGSMTAPGSLAAGTSDSPTPFESTTSSTAGNSGGTPAGNHAPVFERGQLNTGSYCTTARTAFRQSFPPDAVRMDPDRTREVQVEPILRRREVERATRLSKATLYRMMRRGEFPAPIRIGRRAVAWRRREAEEWVATRERVLIAEGHAETGRGGSTQTT